MLDLIVLGDCTVELWCEGHFKPAEPIHAAVGGEAGRTCLAVAGRGLHAGFVSKLGEDLFEPFLRNELSTAGLDLSFCPTVAGVNGVAFGYGPEGKRKWIPYRADTAASTLRFEDLDPDYLKQTAVFQSSGLFQALSASTRAAVRAACDLAAASGIRTVFTACFNNRIWPLQTARDALQELLPAVEIVLLDARHFRSWFGSTAPEEIARWGRQQGAKCVVVRGSGPAFAVATEQGIQTFPVARPGAQDAEFDAAFLAGIRAGLEPAEAVKQAAGGSGQRRSRKPSSVVAYIDGGSRGNPGIAGAGVYLEHEGRPWKGLYLYLGRRTNNFAEYSALLHALRHVLQEGVTRLEVVSDSELLVRQLHGRYRVKDPTLKGLYAEAQSLIGSLEKFSVRHVPREKNRKADALANRAQDEKQSGEETYE